MNRTSKMIGAALGGVAEGLAVGLALAFILCVASSVVAISTDSRATLPGLFAATAGSENGALALEFQPNFAGILVVTGLSVLVRVLVVVRRSNAQTPGPR